MNRLIGPQRRCNAADAAVVSMLDICPDGHRLMDLRWSSCAWYGLERDFDPLTTRPE